MHTIRLAWRNIWRNRRRTLITAIALAVGVALVLFSFALVNGMFDRVVKVATSASTGHGQIHAGDWRTTRDELLVIPDTADVLAAVRATDGVEAASSRIYASALLAVGDRSRGVQVIGVHPAAERRVTHWQDRVVSGRYLEATGEVMIGAELAKKLDVELDTALVLTVAHVHSGDAASERVRLVGLLSTGDPGIDEQSAIVDQRMTQRMLGLTDAHEIALRVDRAPEDRPGIERVLAPLAREGLTIEPWQAINRMVSQALELQSVSMGIFVTIIFLLLAFGIVNTVAMSLAERTREFGVLRAIGTSPGRLAGLIISEAAWLGVIGSGLGVLLGVLLVAWLGATGLDLGGTSAYGVRFSEPLYPKVQLGVSLATGLLFVGLTMLTAGLSAWRAARIRPVEAIHR